MEFKGTKGNFKAGENKALVGIFSEDEKQIAVVHGKNRYEDAKLMAAAPELLEALQLSISIIERISDEYSELANKHSSFTQGEYNKLQKAIEKALK